ncbi:putative MFS transporter [Actinoplanes missouriensis 431]|uniref:Putative MFS transporter n=1 Tax=Actinoplanes missouriensis (strain ATCC 14538 / DSM 43046 / CBS 188.64 / JCM 3121 / NBRC 102363 / NCIMB 12654 / NRRL B-3342 / UNCC 431) TaxID=512565 RepID=I0HC18_ACTM4|nr:MFS transporter [Actinoplanes missouriensis]BAL90555.1 putative MFS transporter [Actinoplanes missouriensis 431]
MRTLLPRLGAGFNRLWAAAAVSNTGDGITMVAGPLLLASITANPALIAGGVFAQQLPWLLFSLVSGVFADRLDRRRLIVVSNLVRAAALAVLTLAVATGQVPVALVYLVLFVLGTGETIVDTAGGALLPRLVAPDLLPRANARLSATFTIANQFAAKPLGAWLFGIAAAAPFAADALSFVVSAALIAALPAAASQATYPATPPETAPSEPAPPETAPSKTAPPETAASETALPPPGDGPATLRADIAEGVRWLRGHRLLRTLAAAMGLGNVAFCSAFAVFVLYAQQRLGLSGAGYGVLLTTFAAGGLIGAAVAARVTVRFGSPAVLRAGLLVEVITHLTLASTTNALVAGAVLVLFGVQTVVWGVITASLRQRLVPDRLLGRVGSVYALLETGGAAAGTLIGGLLAAALGLTTPFWAAAAAMAVILAVAWRPLAEAGRRHGGTGPPAGARS